MGNFNIQTLTLLATIIGVASNLLSISQNLRKNGAISMFKGLSLCILPVLFIQQIILITNKLMLCYNFSILISEFLFVLIIIILNKKEERKTTAKETMLPLATVVSTSLFELQSLYISIFIKDYNDMMNSFITKLSEYKISIEMFIFLSDNLGFAVFTIIDAITVFVLSITFLYTFKYFLEQGKSIDCCIDLEPFDDKSKDYICLITSLFLSSGFVKILIQYVLNLF